MIYKTFGEAAKAVLRENYVPLKNMLEKEAENQSPKCSSQEQIKLKQQEEKRKQKSEINVQ